MIESKCNHGSKCNQCGVCCRLFVINLNEEEYNSRKYKTIFEEFGIVDFEEAELTEKGLTNEDENSLIIKIKTMLNRGSRVKYIHHSAQLNTWQKTIEEIKTGNCHHKDKHTYTTNFEDILKEELKIDEWSALDWENVFSLYQTIIKRIIFSEYLNN